MSNQCEHYVDISLECEECYKIFKILEEYTKKQKINETEDLQNEIEHEDYEDYEPIKSNSSRRSANRFLTYKRFGWIDFVDKKSIINLFMQIERIFNEKCEEKRIPKFSFPFLGRCSNCEEILYLHRNVEI